MSALTFVYGNECGKYHSAETFSREAKFRSQNKRMKKSRFGELSVDQMQGTMSNAVPVTTKKPQSLRLDYLTLLPAKFNSFKCCKIEI